MKEVSCFGCQKTYKLERVGFREECENCGEDLHVCKTCEFYDENVYNECRETSASRITEKTRSNLCEYYSPSGAEKGESLSKKKSDMLNAAEALFKKKT